MGPGAKHNGVAFQGHRLDEGAWVRETVDVQVCCELILGSFDLTHFPLQIL